MKQPRRMRSGSDTTTRANGFAEKAKMKDKLPVGWSSYRYRTCPNPLTPCVSCWVFWSSSPDYRMIIGLTAVGEVFGEKRSFSPYLFLRYDAPQYPSSSLLGMQRLEQQQANFNFIRSIESKEFTLHEETILTYGNLTHTWQVSQLSDCGGMPQVCFMQRRSKAIILCYTFPV